MFSCATEEVTPQVQVKKELSSQPPSPGQPRPKKEVVDTQLASQPRPPGQSSKPPK